MFIQLRERIQKEVPDKIANFGYYDEIRDEMNGFPSFEANRTNPSDKYMQCTLRISVGDLEKLSIKEFLSLQKEFRTSTRQAIFVQTGQRAPESIRKLISIGGKGNLISHEYQHASKAPNKIRQTAFIDFTFYKFPEEVSTELNLHGGIHFDDKK